MELDDRLRTTRQQAGGPEPLTAADDDAERTVYTAGNSEQLPGEVARKDGDQPTGDAAVDEAWQSSAQIWDLFADVFDRRSVDGNGTAITITVHYGTDYDNAFWDGRQLVFGDGDGEVFERFTKPMDVMAHEFTHGVTEHTAALDYQGQSGALNESISDVFAAICKQRGGDQTADEADWLIGEGLFKPDIEAVALRSMKEPGTAYDDPRLGKDPQVGSMADYADTTDDNGGVHINSGIPNRAFYLAAVGLGGRSWEQAGPIWYAALTGGEVTAGTDFAGFAEATVAAAGRLFADDPAVADAVRAAWTGVGVLQASGSDTGATTSGTGTGGSFVVRRSGGVTGITRQTEVDLDTAAGRQIRDLLDRVDLGGISATGGRPDRFSYHLEYGDRQLTIGETELPPEIDQAIKIAFGRTDSAD
ncbi:protealysin inhibitor emfourin [Microlunatus soli]|uniref:protealysin inhibitor emfourin n=1 Tax=Microlunatus soli TaxID=630515 RepID=UPI001E3E956F|nr:protealysin inhibitor emfourin [Microlunatus soli]